MAYRVLEVTLLSAKDLKNVNLIMRMEVYAVATISGDPISRQCTPPDPYGGSNPTWNATLRFAVPPTAEEAKGGCLHILLRAERTFGADRDVGEVIVPLPEVLTGGGLGAPTEPQFASYQVRKVHRTETRGLLYLTYRLGPIAVPPPAKPANVGPVVGYPVQQEMPPPTKLPVHVADDVHVPPSPEPFGHGTAPSKPEVRHVAKPTGQVVSMPPSSKPQVGHVAMPLSPKPTGQVVSMPRSPKTSGYTTTPSKSEVGHLTVPPSPKPTGQVVSMPPSPKPSGQFVSMPLSQKLAGRAVSMPPSPNQAGHEVSMPPSPKPAGQVAVPWSPKPAGGHVAMLSSLKPSPVVGEHIFTQTDIYWCPITR